MENVSDALKMGFAIFIFIFALSLAFSTITQAKEVADFVLFANDKTNYYNTGNILAEDGRIVTIETVISTLYRCEKETMVVNILKEDGTPAYPPFDSAENKETLKQNIADFVNNNVNKDTKYLELFAEAKYNGKEITADDGSSIIVTKGGTKMVITYQETTI